MEEEKTLHNYERRKKTLHNYGGGIPRQEKK
jgi:hypothetical protein